jgi:hypothetical protein
MAGIRTSTKMADDTHKWIVARKQFRFAVHSRDYSFDHGGWEGDTRRAVFKIVVKPFQMQQSEIWPGVGKQTCIDERYKVLHQLALYDRDVPGFDMERSKSLISATLVASVCSCFGPKKTRKPILYWCCRNGTGIVGNNVNGETPLKFQHRSVVIAGGLGHDSFVVHFITS